MAFNANSDHDMLSNQSGFGESAPKTGSKRSAPFGYFDTSDNTTAMPGGPTQDQDQDQDTGMDDNTQSTRTNSSIASAGIKRLKIATVDCTEQDSSSLFVSPTRKTPAFVEAPPSVARRARTPRLNHAQAPPSFGSQARGIANSNPFPAFPQMGMPQMPQMGMQMPPPQMMHMQPPQLTGNTQIDLSATLSFMEQKIQLVSTAIMQPMIDLTKMVKKLEFDNAKLREQINGFQKAVKKSISEISERQDEAESLIDRLGESSSIISPPGAAYGGPKLTGTKKPSLFQGMLSGHQNGTGGGAGGPNA